jgi:hypothetical protein
VYTDRVPYRLWPKLYRFFAGCRAQRHPANNFFIFLKFFAGCLPSWHLAKEFFYFFKKILCRVPPELAPGKGFFAGGQVWHPANYKFFFVFLAPFFSGALVQ